MLEPTDGRRGDELRITVKLSEFQPRQQPGQDALYLHHGRRGTQTEVHAAAKARFLGAAADVEPERPARHRRHHRTSQSSHRRHHLAGVEPTPKRNVVPSRHDEKHSPMSARSPTPTPTSASAGPRWLVGWCTADRRDDHAVAFTAECTYQRCCGAHCHRSRVHRANLSESDVIIADLSKHGSTGRVRQVRQAGDDRVVGMLLEQVGYRTE